MDITKKIDPGERSGTVAIPASKSIAHRLLIMAALSDTPATLECNGFSNDILATIDCLNALGCIITTEDGHLIHTVPISLNNNTETSSAALLPCRDSGSTLRFLLPLVGALGAKKSFKMEGRLPERPLSPYDTELEAHGMKLERKEDGLLACSGVLTPGSYTLPGNVSSQYISGLLMSLPLLGGDSTLTITGNIESLDYIRMTEDVLKLAGIRFDHNDQTYRIPGGQKYDLPEKLTVEADWSGAAFFLCLGALSQKGVTVKGLNPNSSQGDKAILDILERFGASIIHKNGLTDSSDRSEAADEITVRFSSLHGCEIDASFIPDLIPVVSVVAAAAQGTTHIINASRLRLKESDRLRTTAEMLTRLGIQVTEGEDSLTIQGCGYSPSDPEKRLSGADIDSHNDHRIAMSAAVAASICDKPVFIGNPECVKKSFADFWEKLDSLFLKQEVL